MITVYIVHHVVISSLTFQAEKQLELQLFKLYHNERDIDGLTEELGRKQKVVGKENTKKEKIEEEIKDKKKEGGKLSREFTKIEQNIKETVSFKGLWGKRSFQTEHLKYPTCLFKIRQSIWEFLLV